jgi:uncharacterized membrane protein
MAVPSSVLILLTERDLLHNSVDENIGGIIASLVSLTYIFEMLMLNLFF